MIGLHIYVNPVGRDTVKGQGVFYSRRAHGPYYRWSYEGDFGQWRGSRMPLSEMTPQALCARSWRTVPAALQAKLGEHYLE